MTKSIYRAEDESFVVQMQIIAKIVGVEQKI